MNAPYMSAYIDQVQMYMWMSGLDESTFLFFNKNTADMHSFTVRYNPQIVKALINKTMLVRNGIKNRELPECHCPEGEHKKLALAC